MKTLILLINSDELYPLVYEAGHFAFIEYIGDHSELDETNLEELDEEHELIRFIFSRMHLYKRIKTEDDLNENKNIRFLNEPSKDFDIFIKMYS